MRLLILSAGGSRGAYQAGVIRGLCTHQKDWQPWDIIAGNSVGAINASFIAQSTKQFQCNKTQKLLDLWHNIKSNRDIYDNYWIFSFINGFFKGGLYSQKPLKKIIDREIKPSLIHTSNVELYVGAVSSTSGDLKIASNSDENILDWILASAAIPVLFRPVKIQGDLYIDGGVVDMVFDISRYNRNLESVDIILGENLKKHRQTKPKNIVGVANRTINFMIRENTINDIKNIFGSNIKNVKIYQPSPSMGINSLDFSPKSIKKMIQLGYEHGKDQRNS